VRPLLRWYDGPAGWLPIYDRCRYLRDWVAVKHRWRLTVDSTEKAALTADVSTYGCANSTITVTLARWRVVRRVVR